MDLSRLRGPIYGALVALAILAVYTMVLRKPAAEEIEIIVPTATGIAEAAAPTATAAPILVHVVGAVAQPGVYALTGDARVTDAVRAAGGLTEAADASMINLADRVSDGQQVRVPALGVEPGPTLTPYPVTSAQRSGSTVPVVAGNTLININTATAAELETLSGIGPVLAERIVAHRAANGPFGTIEDIMDVSGIGEGYFARIRDSISVE
ncbi:MAG: helix-hairpin-helix domain-containing protein [Anaerolineae bacterium]|nr:hypothetical protein [Chloroflexota bacterium]